MRYRISWAVVLLVVAEVAAIAAVVSWIGPWPTVAVLIAQAGLGMWLARRAGGRAWRTVADGVRAGDPSAAGIGEQALSLTGALLLIVPGFVTDVIAVLCLLAPTQPLVRRAGALLRWGRTSRPAGYASSRSGVYRIRH